MSTDAQINANRANSQHSTGPKTVAGKAISSHNAVTSAPTGRTILLPNDDIPRYEKLAHEMIEFHKPFDYMEGLLVQSLTDTESALFGLAQREMSSTLSEDPETRQLQIEMHYDLQFRNLRLQETRLRRTYREDLARLEKIQAARKATAEAAAQGAGAAKISADKAATVPEPQPATREIGFEFSTTPKATKQSA